jgi:hypothetical protein
MKRQLGSALLSLGIFLLVLSSLMRAIPPAAPQASWAESTTQYRLEGYDAQSGKWTTGAVKGYAPGDCIPFRLAITAAVTETVTLEYDKVRGGIEGIVQIEEIAVRVATSSVGTAYPHKVSDQTEMWQVQIELTPESDNVLITWCARLGPQVDQYPGASLQMRAYGIGDRTVPIPISGILAPTPTPTDTPLPEPTATPTETPTPTPTSTPSSGSITVHKFHDANRNGSQDAGEEDIEGWLIRVYQYDDTGLYLVAEGYTGADGTITFTGLVPSQYKVWEQAIECWEPIVPPGLNAWSHDQLPGYYTVVNLDPDGSTWVEFGNDYVCEEPTPTGTPTNTPTNTPTPTETPPDPPTATPTDTPTPTNTPTNTPTPTDTPPGPPTATPTDTPTPPDPPTATPTDTPVPPDPPTATPTDTPVPRDPPTATPTDTPVRRDPPTATPTDTPAPPDPPTATPTDTPDEPPGPTDTPTPTPTKSLPDQPPVTATPSATPEDDDPGCTSRVYVRYCLPAPEGGTFWVASIRTTGHKILSEGIVSPGWNDWSSDVPNGSRLQLWFWNEREGDHFVSEFYSGDCEYPHLYADLCQVPPTPTPTATWAVRELPTTGSVTPTTLPPAAASWLAQAGLVLVAAGAVLRRLGW